MNERSRKSRHHSPQNEDLSNESALTNGATYDPYFPLQHNIQQVESMDFHPRESEMNTPPSHHEDNQQHIHQQFDSIHVQSEMNVPQQPQLATSPQPMEACTIGKKVNGRYTKLRKQLRTYGSFKDNYFVIDLSPDEPKRGKKGISKPKHGKKHVEHNIKFETSWSPEIAEKELNATSHPQLPSYLETIQPHPPQQPQTHFPSSNMNMLNDYHPTCGNSTYPSNTSSTPTQEFHPSSNPIIQPYVLSDNKQYMHPEDLDLEQFQAQLINSQREPPMLNLSFPIEMNEDHMIHMGMPSGNVEERTDNQISNMILKLIKDCESTNSEAPLQGKELMQALSSLQILMGAHAENSQHKE